MDIIEAMKNRHSVRRYADKPIEEEKISALKNEIESCNKEGDLQIRLICDEPKAFGGVMAHYGKFDGVKNYIALVGKKSADLEEKCGYYGEKLVLAAQQLGLNTCWVALTYKKIPEALKLEKDEKLTVVIALGYGKKQGHAHVSKSAEKVSNLSDASPDWFKKGVEAALLAPTAMNQQKFYLSYENGKVTAKAGMGFYAKTDLGIVKYHFEAASGMKI